MQQRRTALMTTKEFISRSDAVLGAEMEAVGRLISWTLSGFGVGVVVFTMLRLVPHGWALPFTMLWFLGITLYAFRDLSTGRTPAGLFSLRINLTMWVFVAVVVAITKPLPDAGTWYLPCVILWCAVVVVACLKDAHKARTATGQFDLRCPHCHTNLLRMRTVVIASRHCGRCGARVLEENSLSSDALSEQAPDALFTTIDPGRRRQRVTFYLSVAVMAVNIYLLSSLSLTNYVVPIPSDGRPPGLKIGPAMPVANIPHATYLSVSLDSTFAETRQPNDAKRTHFGVVAQQVVQVIETMFKGRKISDRRPIVISQKEQLSFFAIADAKSDPRRIYVYFDKSFSKDMIGDRSYAQFAFLLSNALGHVILNPRREDALMETLAAAIALETCDRLTDAYPGWDLPQEWQEYGANYKAYSNLRFQALLKRSRASVAQAIRHGWWDRVTQYLIKYRHKVDAMHGKKERWYWILLGVVALRSQPVPWPELVDFAARTPTDLRGASPDLRKALTRIGRAPGMRPKTVSKTGAR